MQAQGISKGDVLRRHSGPGKYLVIGTLPGGYVSLLAQSGEDLSVTPRYLAEHFWRDTSEPRWFAAKREGEREGDSAVDQGANAE